VQLLRASKAPQAVAAALDDAVWRLYLALPCAPHARAYYRAVAGDSLNDCSFILQEAERVLAAVICDAADGSLAQFGFPIEPLLRAGLSHAVRKDIAVQTLAELRRIARERDARTVKVRSAARNDADGLLLGLLAEEGASTEVELRAEVDLRSGEEALLADLRASYRRHLRWA